MHIVIWVILAFFLSLHSISAQQMRFSPINVQHGLSDNQIRYILQLPDGRMVFKTSGNINIYDGIHFKNIHQGMNNPYPLSKYDGFYRIYQEGDSVLWIKDFHQLLCIDLKKEKYVAQLSSHFTSIGFKQKIDNFFIDAGQRVWLQVGNQLIQKNTKQAIQITPHIGDLQDVSSDQGEVYLFYSTGIVVCYDLKIGAVIYQRAAYPPAEHSFFSRTSLVVKGKSGFYQLRNGSKGGFFYFDLNTRSWTKKLETPYSLNTLAVSHNSGVSISCKSGLWMSDEALGRLTYLPKLTTVDGSILNTEVSTVFYDQQGGLWLGTLNQGLMYHHAERHVFKSFRHADFPKSHTGDINVIEFAESNQGKIYLQSQTQVYRFDPSNRQLSANVQPPPPEVLMQFKKKKETHSVSDNVTSQLVDRRGLKWVGTRDGLKIYQPHKREPRIIYAKDGLSNNFIQGIVEDRHGDVWVSTSYGINNVKIGASQSSYRIASYFPDAGTLAGEYIDGAVFESKGGTLYFGGVNGFSLLEPAQPLTADAPSKPLLTGVFLRGEKIEVDQVYNGNRLLPVAPPYIKALRLNHDQNFITFEFAPLDYKNASHTYYRYQLVGIDKDWQETSGSWANGRLSATGDLPISYTNLPPGKYILNVMASPDRNWKAPIRQIAITIVPPWWRTPMAYLLYVVIASTVLVTLISIYFKQTRKKMERLHREDILLLRIRNLVDQQNLLRENSTTTSITSDDEKEADENENGYTQADLLFLNRAVDQVEKNMNITTYSVEQLSRDLHMDRTGLYRKLIALMDKSPSLFIRNIRLENAARLIVEGEMSISEISHIVGFSSSSYMSKCFQEMYGCKPSEYARKHKNQQQ